MLPQPITRYEGSRPGIAAFCAGIGSEYPDIVASADRMSRAEFETCLENKVLDVIEVEVGASAVVVVIKKGDRVFNLTPRMVYYALAENIPIKGEFNVNENKTWKDIEKDAPDVPITLSSRTGFGTRIFRRQLMQAVAATEVDAIFAADRMPVHYSAGRRAATATVEDQVVDARKR